MACRLCRSDEIKYSKGSLKSQYLGFLLLLLLLLLAVAAGQTPSRLFPWTTQTWFSWSPIREFDTGTLAGRTRKGSSSARMLLRR